MQKKNYFHVIPPKKIHLLKESLNKARMRTRLGIQNNPPNDPKKASKDAKKEDTKQTYNTSPSWDLG
jgi:hypothetical protein